MVLQLHYDIFRNIADGMEITMSLYGILSYFKNKSMAFLLYSIALLSGLVEFYVVDQYYKNGILNVSLETSSLWLTCFNIILYCIFMLNMFDIHTQEKLIYKKIKLVIVTLAIAPIIDTFLKSTHQSFVMLLWLYSIIIIICSILIIFILYDIYQLKSLFSNYYFIGTIIAIVGWFLKSVFQTFPVSFPNLITFDNNNAFTFPNTYAQLSNIFESIFMFIGISESYKLSELSNIDLKRKILLSIEEKSNDDKVFINIKQEILVKINITFNQHLLQSSALIEETLQLLALDNKVAAKEKLSLFSNSTAQSIQTIRMIVSEFNEQSSLTFNKSIESKAFEIAKYHLSQKKISFDLYVNESELWLTVGNHFEKQVLIFYEQILKIFIKYKDFLHLMTNFAMHKDGNIFVIIQDDGNKIVAKNRMIRELNLISSQLLDLQGKIAYSVEDGSNSTVRLDFIINPKRYHT